MENIIVKFFELPVNIDDIVIVLSFGEFNIHKENNGRYFSIRKKDAGRPATSIDMPVLGAQTIESLERAARAEITSGSDLGKELEKTIEEEKEKRNPSEKFLGTSLGEDLPGGWGVYYERKLEIWKLQLVVHNDFENLSDAENYAVEVALKTLVAHCGGWQLYNNSMAGWYIMQTHENSRIIEFTGQNSSGVTLKYLQPDIRFLGPLPIRELVRLPW